MCVLRCTQALPAPGRPLVAMRSRLVRWGVAMSRRVTHRPLVDLRCHASKIRKEPPSRPSMEERVTQSLLVMSLGKARRRRATVLPTKGPRSLESRGGHCGKLGSMPPRRRRIRRPWRSRERRKRRRRKRRRKKKRRSSACWDSSGSRSCRSSNSSSSSNRS